MATELDLLIDGFKEPRNIDEAKVLIKILRSEIDRLAFENNDLRKEIRNLIETLSTRIDKSEELRQKNREISRLYDMVLSYKDSLNMVYEWCNKMILKAGKQDEKI